MIVSVISAGPQFSVSPNIVDILMPYTHKHNNSNNSEIFTKCSHHNGKLNGKKCGRESIECLLNAHGMVSDIKPLYQYNETNKEYGRDETEVERKRKRWNELRKE